MSIIVRLLQDHESESVNDFFNSIYASNRSLENFRWEFLEGPNGKAIYVVAVDDSVQSHTKIVGIQCAIPLEFIMSNGTVVLTAKSEDTLVDPTYRGQKIFERMYDLLFEECKNRGVKYIWGFTPALKAFERIGFLAPFIAHQALMVFNPFIAYRHLSQLNANNTIIDKFKILGLCFLSMLKGILSTTLVRTRALSILPGGENIKSFKEFYSKENYATLNQTQDYINWRLIRNPHENNYSSFRIQNDKGVIADIIINTRKVGYIEQMFLSPSSSQEERKRIVQFVLTNLKLKKISLVRVLCFDCNSELKSQSRLLSTAGFIVLRRGNYFVWKSLDPTNAVLPNQLLLNRLFLQGNM